LGPTLREARGRARHHCVPNTHYLEEAEGRTRCACWPGAGSSSVGTPADVNAQPAEPGTRARRPLTGPGCAAILRRSACRSLVATRPGRAGCPLNAASARRAIVSPPRGGAELTAHPVSSRSPASDAGEAYLLLLDRAGYADRPGHERAPGPRSPATAAAWAHELSAIAVIAHSMWIRCGATVPAGGQPGVPDPAHRRPGRHPAAHRSARAPA